MLYPLLYEINTRCWLRDLSQKSSAPITLATVPDSEFSEWRRLAFTHIWLMGVWTTGPCARSEALHSWQQHQGYCEALPGLTDADIEGSPYAIADYNVPSAFGGDEALREFRRKLHAYGLKLFLDFVPNHFGLDHPWITEHPDLFVQTQEGVSPKPAPLGTFPRQTNHGPRIFAHGKDPNFSAWTDTIQLDYRLPQTQAKMLELLRSIADRCDGVRCDMAMLILPDVFAQTWSRFPIPTRPEPPPSPPQEERAGERRPFADFWFHAIPAIKQSHPGFLFLAEVYWGLEPRLQELGFDFTYDKELYDRLIARDAPGVQRHLFQLLSQSPNVSHASSPSGPSPSPPSKEERAGERRPSLSAVSPQSCLSHGAHFLENHDERRAADILTFAEHRAAALIILGLPGMRLLHEGQLTGARRRVPVQLSRRFAEPKVEEITRMYEQLLTLLPQTSVGQGKADLLKPRSAWPENPTAENFILIQWQSEPDTFDLVAVNYAGHQSQCYVPLTIPNLSVHDWQIRDLLNGEQFIRSGRDLANGLYLDLPPHAACLFHFSGGINSDQTVDPSH
jgi:glycosidase